MVAIPTLTAVAAATLTMHQQTIPLPSTDFNDMLAEPMPTRTLTADYSPAKLSNGHTVGLWRKNIWRNDICKFADGWVIPCPDDQVCKPQKGPYGEDTMISRCVDKTTIAMPPFQNTTTTTTSITVQTTLYPTAPSNAQRAVSYPPMVCKIGNGWTIPCPHGEACRPQRGDSGEELDTHICVPIAMPFDDAPVATASAANACTCADAAPTGRQRIV